MSWEGLALALLGLCIIWAAFYCGELSKEWQMSRVLVVASNFPRAKWEAEQRNLPESEWYYGDPHNPERAAGLTLREVVYIEGWDRDISRAKGSEVKFYFDTLAKAQTGSRSN
jgi:hypothetical protein